MTVRRILVWAGAVLVLLGALGPSAVAQLGDAPSEWRPAPAAPVRELGERARDRLAPADRPADKAAEGDRDAAKAGVAGAVDAPATAPIEPPGPFPIVTDLPDPARFVVAPLRDEVSLGMGAFVQRVISDLGPGDVLVLDINTFGGRVDAAVAIRDALLSARDRGIVTVAFIRPRAISAGALISLATDVIAVAPGSTMGAATPVTIQGGDMQPVDEKVVSYMRQEMRATAEARGRNGDIAAAMVDASLAVPGVIEKGQVLTLDGKQALAWGIASLEAKNLDELYAGLGYGPEGKAFTAVPVGWSWAERVAGLISGSMLSGLLMTIGMLGIMIGLYTGGSPVPLAVGGVCLALFFFGHHVVNLAGIETYLLFGLGLALVVFELVVPGYIVPAVIGVLLIILSLFLGLIDLSGVPLIVQWEQGWITRALAMVFGSILLTALLTYAAFRVLPSSALARKLTLETRLEGHAFRADEDEGEAGAGRPSGLVGQRGVADTGLRPAGRVVVGGTSYDAVAARGYLPAGAEVVVTGRRGFSLVVDAPKDALEDAATDAPNDAAQDASKDAATKEQA